MTRFLRFFFFVVLIGDYVLRQLGFGQMGRLIPEALAGLVLIVAAIQFGVHRRLMIPHSYLIWLMFFTLVLFAGTVVNGTPEGAIVSGIREYFKYVPIFLLPLVYEFSEKQLREIFLWLLVLACFQLPISVHQRFVEFAGFASGDPIMGTLSASGPLSAFLICVWVMVLAQMLRKRIGLLSFLVLTVILLAPTMLNETKGSVVLLPIAIYATLYLSENREHFLKQSIFAGIGFTILFTAYSALDYLLLGARFGRTWFDFFLDPESVRRYIARSSDGSNQVGRWEKLMIAIEEISKDPGTLFLGVGIGNAGASGVSFFQGEYSEMGENKMMDSGITLFLWEMGLLGLLLAMLLPAMVFFDATRLRTNPGFDGAIAQGIGGVAIVLFFASFWILTPYDQVISYVFFFCAAVLIARKHAYANTLAARSYAKGPREPVDFAKLRR